MRIVVSVVIAACWTTITVQSFRPPPPPHFDIRPLATMGRIRTDLAMVTMGKNADDYADEFDILPRYGLGGADLSRRWIELVRGGHVSALATLSDTGGDNGGPATTTTTVRYGVRLEEGATEGGRLPRLLEFVESPSSAREEGGGERRCATPLLRRIASINETLVEMQGRGRSRQRSDECGDDGTSMRCAYDDPYAAQLQLVRTLRPPRSREMMRGGGGDPGKVGAAVSPSSCLPPPYDPSGDSFVVGPLRLFGPAGEFHGDGPPRERAARLAVPGGGDDASCDRYWDVYHNVSPVGTWCEFYLVGRTSVQTMITLRIPQLPRRSFLPNEHIFFRSPPIARCSLFSQTRGGTI